MLKYVFKIDIFAKYNNPVKSGRNSGKIHYSVSVKPESDYIFGNPVLVKP